MHFLSSQDPDKKKTPTTKLLASEIAAGVSSYSFFFQFDLLQFEPESDWYVLMCAKFCAGHSDTKMGRTKSRAQDAQNVVGGADEETSQ